MVSGHFLTPNIPSAFLLRHGGLNVVGKRFFTSPSKNKMVSYQVGRTKEASGGSGHGAQQCDVVRSLRRDGWLPKAYNGRSKSLFKALYASEQLILLGSWGGGLVRQPAVSLATVHEKETGRSARGPGPDHNTIGYSQTKTLDRTRRQSHQANRTSPNHRLAKQTIPHLPLLAD